ncbi:MAG: 30S ribosomal protein S6 [Candidatus Taylorbacteria bacterium]|nr:30S ribosomal protein S6 [Candidatus Taylorbacteria bacterium]
MDENVRDDRMSVYEIGYLLAGLPEERIEAEASGVKDVITRNGGVIIAEEAPHHEKLAYTISKKMVSGSYDKYDEAHFGWVKFEAASNKIDAIKKTVEVIPSVLRLLVTTTVRENTYLGKRASLIAASFARKPMGAGEIESAQVPRREAPIAAPATVVEIDKSIDEMVKEV